MVQKKLLSSVAAIALLNTAVIAESKENLGKVKVWETELVSSSLKLKDNYIETKQADHLSDLLSSMPGVDIGGTHSINNRLNIRGLQDENIEITVDGAKVQNANMFHHIGNLLINPDILKKVDIEVGTNSVVNGSLGGAVSFETKDGEDLLEDGKTFGARVQGNYNSNKSTSGSIAGYGKIGSNGDFLIYHNQVKKENWKDGTGEEAFGVKGDTGNTLLKLGYKSGENQKITISYDLLKDKGDYSPRPDFGKDYNQKRTGDDTYPTEYVRNTVTLKHQYKGENIQVNTVLYSNENELERQEGPLSSGAAVRPGKTKGLLNGKVKTVGGTIKGQSIINSESLVHTLTYGLVHDTQTSEVTWDGEQYGKDEKAITKALYIENKMLFANDLVVTPGVRYNNYDLDGANGELDDTVFTYSLGVEVPVTETVTLLGSKTTLFKGPEMVDVLATNRLNGSADNSKDLKSETGDNKEIGLQYSDNGTLGADSIGFVFKYFNTTIKDSIENKWSSDWSYNYMENVGELELKGFETSFAYDVGNLHTLTTYSTTKTEFKETQEKDPKDPGDSITFNLGYSFTSNLKLAWQTINMSDESAPDGDYNDKEGYRVHDIAINYKPSSIKGLTLVGGIDNITDEEYISHISENRTLTYQRGNPDTANSADFEPGRNIKVSVSYKF